MDSYEEETNKRKQETELLKKNNNEIDEHIKSLRAGLLLFIFS